MAGRRRKAPILSPVQKRVLIALIAFATETGPASVADLSTITGILPGPIARSLGVLNNRRYVDVIEGAKNRYRPLRDTDGMVLTAAMPGIQYYTRGGGVRVTVIPAMPARGYGAFKTAVTAKPRHDGLLTD